MKKTLIVSLIVVATLAIFATAAFAQGAQPGTGTDYRMGTGHAAYMMGGVEGLLHDYIVNAVATALKLTPAEVESRLAAGETLYDISVAQGIAVDKIPALIKDAHTAALDAAVKAGVITQAQADWMKTRGFGSAMGTGACTGTGTPAGGAYGAGMMGGGRGPHGGQTQTTQP